MKKILIIILLLLLTSCTPKQDDIITVSEDGYVVVNGVKTSYLVQRAEDEFSISPDGYLIVNGKKTNYLIQKHEDVITVSDDGYLIVNGQKTSYYVFENEEFDLVVAVNEEGYWIIDNTITNHTQNEKLEIKITNDNYLQIFEIKTKIQVESKEIPVNNYENYGDLYPNVKPRMLDSAYWINLYDDSDELIMTKDEIKLFNERTLKNGNTNIVDLLKIKPQITKIELVNLINQYQIPDYQYLDNNIITNTDKNLLLEKRNLDNISEVVDVKYGIITNNTSMRSFPTSQKITSSIDGDFDYFQETGLKIGEGVIIYHQTADQKWSFVRAINYAGWIKSCDIGLCTKDQFAEFLNPEKFIIITANKYSLFKSSYNEDISNIILDMGTKLPILKNPPAVVDRRTTIGCYVALIPRTNVDGMLKVVQVAIPVTDDVANGYLDYNLKNLYTQALKLVGTPYGWGDMDGNRDCSSTVSAIYKCFGFIMPRNTSNQDDIPGSVVSLANIKPGSLIFTPGHVLFYLGQVDNHHYVLHNFTKYKTSPSGPTYSAMSCHITTLDLYRSNGVQYQHSISKIIALN